METLLERIAQSQIMKVATTFKFVHSHIHSKWAEKQRIFFKGQNKTDIKEWQTVSTETYENVYSFKVPVNQSDFVTALRHS